MPHQTHLTEEMQRCINDCNECYTICISTSNHCLMMGGKHAEAGHIRTMLDCADICQTAARFMLRGSEHHRDTCGVCAEICRVCAESCERIDSSDADMKRCAEICRRCADSCEKMSGGRSRRAGG